MNRSDNVQRMLRKLLRILPLTMLTTSLCAHAIIIRHDTSDTGYQELAGRYPQVFWLHESLDNRLCLATLVDDEWALTAAHCLQETPMGDVLAAGENWSVRLGNDSNAIDRVIVHPGYDAATAKVAGGIDLALVHLARPVAISPMGLYRESDELGQEVSIMGWGNTGSGLQARRDNDHRFRVAQNAVTLADKWLEFVFDDPRISRSKALELEGMPGMGDSGGPALIFHESGFLLVGVARGELQTGEIEQQQGLYGAVAIYERVSLHVQWILGVIEDS